MIDDRIYVKTRSVPGKHFSHLYVPITTLGVPDVGHLLKFGTGGNELQNKSVLTTAQIELLSHFRI